MYRFKLFMSRLKWKLSNLNGFMDYLWVAITGFNAYQLVIALMTGNLVGIVLSGLFLFVCLSSLLR